MPVINEYVKIKEGRNINGNDNFGKTSFQCPTKLARVAANAGISFGYSL